jgi:hypothetical protein
MKVNIFFTKSGAEFFKNLTQEDKDFYMSMDLDLENYDEKKGVPRDFETLQEFFQFVKDINSEGSILTVEKGRVNLTVFNE